MFKFFKTIFGLAIISIGLSAHSADTNLYLFGGGPRPQAALANFVSDVQGGPILIVAWASQMPEEAVVDIVNELKALGANLKVSLRPPVDDVQREDWLQLLKKTRGIFFTGGDQSRIIDAFSMPGNMILLKHLKRKFKRGYVVAGTSAGSAAAADLMITGTSTLPRPGLGFFPGSMIDTHFYARNRQERLERQLSFWPSLTGIGIDEGGLIQVQGSRYIKNLGPKNTYILKPQKNGYRLNLILPPGMSLDIYSSQNNCSILLERP